MRKEQTNFRVDADAKKAAYAVLETLGLKPTDAVNMFIHHIAMYKELPFQPKIPNDETLEAFKELENGGGKTYTLEEFKASLSNLQE